MSNVARPGIALACICDVLPAPARADHFALARELLNRRAQERSDLTDGYAFRFDADALASLAAFIDNERKCCPFLSIEIRVAPDSGPIWLRMTGPEGTREVLRRELELSGFCGCNEAAQASDCDVCRVSHTHPRVLTWAVVGGVAAAVGVCAAGCLLPAVLIGVGITGAWVGSMDSLTPYKWIFFALAATMLGFVYYRLYGIPRNGPGTGEIRDIGRMDRLVRRMLWAGTALTVFGIAYGLIEPWVAK
jgi:mercuric ion transport protein